MAFESLADFLAMGKHGPYVWSCYGLTFMVVFGLLWQARVERKHFMREQLAQMRRDARKNPAVSGESDDASEA